MSNDKHKPVTFFLFVKGTKIFPLPAWLAVRCVIVKGAITPLIVLRGANDQLAAVHVKVMRSTPVAPPSGDDTTQTGSAPLRLSELILPFLCVCVGVPKLNQQSPVVPFFSFLLLV